MHSKLSKKWIKLFSRSILRKSKHLFLLFFFILVPSGKPTITAAHNTSSTSIQLVWRPPSKTSINGEFLGYRIAYRPRNDNLSHQSTEMLLKDPEVTQFTILDLSPFTQYLVSLQVVNPAGLGPPTKVVVMTDEGGKFVVGTVIFAASAIRKCLV